MARVADARGFATDSRQCEIIMARVADVRSFATGLRKCDDGTRPCLPAASNLFPDIFRLTVMVCTNIIFCKPNRLFYPFHTGRRLFGIA